MTVDARPRKARIVAWIAAVVIVVVFSAIATALTGSTGEGTAVFRTGDQAAMVGLGIFGALGALAFARPRVWANREGVRVRNVFATYDLPWGVVRSIRFEAGHPWAQLELQDDDTVSILAVQATDKELAVAAIRGLRALHAAYVTSGGAAEQRASDSHS
ncbi:MAG: PH domain-containing protein [Hamadaea sp.]|nr:PH domain-containing protein [Hamadaea sp.]